MTSPSHAYDSSVISHLFSIASLEEAELEHVRKHALTTRIHDDLELREYVFCSGTRRLYEDNQADSVREREYTYTARVNIYVNIYVDIY